MKDAIVNSKSDFHSETAFIKLQIPSYSQIELESDNTRFMRELTQNYNELKQIDRDAIEPTEYSYWYQKQGPTLSDDDGLLSFSFSQGSHVKIGWNRSVGKDLFYNELTNASHYNIYTLLIHVLAMVSMTTI